MLLLFMKALFKTNAFSVGVFRIAEGNCVPRELHYKLNYEA